MTRFKIGDKIRCSCGYLSCDPNRVYEVTGFQDSMLVYEVIDKVGKRDSIMYNHAVAADDPNVQSIHVSGAGGGGGASKSRVPKFSQGQEVWYGGFKGEIQDHLFDGANYYYNIVFRDDNGALWFQGQVPENLLALAGMKMHDANYIAPKCDCGTLKTYGADVPKEAHSTWCDLVKVRA